jgi:ATP sulfurylase|tara:strand:- start:193 stop:450 length:258 start_codon:yes stop_codon:yes gene_type:complete
MAEKVCYMWWQKINCSSTDTDEVLSSTSNIPQWVLTPEAIKELFNAIIKQSQRQINSNDQQFMYEEFRAQQAEIDLDKEIQRLTN